MSEKQQRRVFNFFLSTINERQIKNKEMTEEWVHEDLRDNINGREIRNVLFSVIAFARANGRSLEVKDFKIMRDSKRRFEEYLR